jgi:dTDP-4-dehydrorhamnose reductase
LITGATGTLAQALGRFCRVRGLVFHLLSRRELDVADEASVDAAVDALRPWAVVNAAGYVRVDDAEADAARCFRENVLGPSTLAAVCARRGARLLTFSSDLVFDGTTQKPYVESDGVSPLSVYGRSKARAEREVLRRLPEALVVRTSAFFGPWDEHNFLAHALRSLACGRPFRAAADSVVSPTYVPDLVDASLDLLIDGESGIWHLANRGALTWADFARRGAVLAGLDARLVEECATAALGLAAARPRYSALGSERGHLLPPLERSLERWSREREPTALAS